MLQVVATDTDAGADGDVYYSMPNHLQFRLDSATGIVYSKAALDYEATTSYTLTITATDGGVPALSADVTLTVTVTDENDNLPDCTPSSFSATLREDSGAGTTVASLTCTDDDSGTAGTLDYSIETVNGGPGPGPFAVDSSGVVTIGTALDYETDTVHTLEVITFDTSASPETSTVIVAVTVTDVNEFAPTFTAQPTSQNLAETTPVGTYVNTIVASDLDTAETIIYYFSPANTYFAIDPWDGSITVRDVLDREAIATHTLTVVAEDSGTVDAVRSSSHVFTVTITDSNDETPTFSPAAYVATPISESVSLGTTVVTVTATDTDAGSFGDVTYAITSGNGDNIFRVDTTAGQLGEIVVDDLTNLDYEATTSYELVIQATDGGGLSGSATVYIGIEPYNEFTPVFNPSDQYTIPLDEDTAASIVGAVAATDADDGSDGLFTFQVVPSVDKIDVDPDTGDIHLVSGLDREMAQTHTIYIKVTDQGLNPGVLSATATLTLSVNDVNDEYPECTQGVYQAEIPEDSASGDSVAQLSCTDADLDPSSLNNAITYALVVSAHSANFDIDASSGEITVSSSASLDYETTDLMTIEVDVADLGTPALTSTVTVMVAITGMSTKYNVRHTGCQSYYRKEQVLVLVINE